jgi:hypothetical protein
VRVAGRHHDRCGDLGAVDERDTETRSPLHMIVSTGLLVRSDAPGRPRTTRAVRSGTSRCRRSGGRPSPTWRMACVSAPEAAAGHLRGDAPHHRSGQRGRPHDGVVVEERTQHVGRRAARPPQQRPRSAEPASQRELGEAAHGRRLGGGEIISTAGARRDVAAVAVDLGGEVSAESSRVASRSPGATSPCPRPRSPTRSCAAPARRRCTRGRDGRGRAPRSPGWCGRSGGRSCRC